jgi:hypothetical protein
MNRELILKLLESLGLKVTADGADGTMKEDDAVKLIEESFAAGNLGLLQKRDQLLAQEVELKKKITAMETSATETNKKIGELETQLKKNSPEDNKKYYESQLSEAKTKFEQELAGVSADRDKYRESHFARVRDDAVNEAVKDIQFIDGLRDGFISLAMTRNQFKPIEVDGKTAFTNQNHETLQAVLHQLSLSKEGMAYIKNGNQGGGALGGQNPGVAVQGNKMARTDFMALSDQAKMDFTSKGGFVTD